MTAPADRAILIVEDDPSIRALLAMFLEDEGYATMEAADGVQAIAALRDHRPPPERLCLVILDMMLPTLDGAAVLQTLSELGRYVPVVAVSADQRQLARAARAGADATLPKPFDFDALLTVMERNCRR